MDDLKNQVSRFWETQHGINMVYEEYARQVGLSYTALYILAYIEYFENCTQSLICSRTFIPRQTVNSVVTGLYKKGYVELRELPENRRVKTIHFTPAGKEYADSVLKKLHEAEFGAMAALSDDDREQLIRTNRSYMEQFQKLIR